MGNNRKILGLIVLAIAILSSIGYFFFGQTVPEDPSKPKGNKVTFSGSELKEEKDGKIIWAVKAESIEVDPRTKEIVLTNVKGVFTKDNVEMNITAPKGHVTGDHKIIDLSEGVTATNTEGVEFTTSAITFDNNKKEFITKTPFTFVDKETTITGDTLWGNMVLQEIKAKGHARLVRK